MKIKHYSEKINLLVTEREIEVPIYVEAKECEFNNEITAKIKYSDNEYIGKGTSIDWTDAFANLQKTLPDNVKLKCCLTCKHGTLCPYGDIPNYVLCSQSQRIDSKDDVIEWLDRVDVEKMKRTAFQNCSRFEFVDENYYTYNDFVYFLKK